MTDTKRMRSALEYLLEHDEGYPLTERDIWDIKAIIAEADDTEHHAHKDGTPCVQPDCDRAQIPYRMIVEMRKAAEEDAKEPIPNIEDHEFECRGGYFRMSVSPEDLDPKREELFRSVLAAMGLM